MPTWLIFLFVTCVVVGIAYCLALWNANRDCRNCRIAFFVVSEVAGCWLLFNGLTEDNNQRVTFGTILLVVANLWFCARCFSSWLDKKKAQRENIKREKAQEGAGVTVAATAIAAGAVVGSLSADDRNAGPDHESQSAIEGGDADADLDIGLDF